MANPRICSIPGCGKKHSGLGYCKNHWYRYRKFGDPLAGPTPDGEPMRFFEEVVMRHGGDDCLAWPYAKDSNGYGQLRQDGRTQYVIRLVCERLYGPPPSRKHQAAHSCGRGHEGCCAPNHLRWATVKDNHADKREHGTYTAPPICSKLSSADVQAIRSLKGKMSQRAIAAKFGVQHAAIGAIHRGRTWGDA